MQRAANALLPRVVAWRRYLFFSTAAPTAAAPTAAADAPERRGYAFRALAEADFRSAPVFAEKGREGRFIERLRLGHLCLGFVSEDGDVASYLWLSSGRDVPFALTLRLRLPETAWYIWDCRTAERHARRGLYSGGLVRARAWMGPGKAFWISCEAGNLPSVRGIAAAGFERKCSLSLLKVGPWRRLKLGSGAAKWAPAGAALALSSESGPDST